MLSSGYWAQAFINSLEKETGRVEDGIETLKILSSWASSLPDEFFDNTAAEKLETLLREKIKLGEIAVRSSASLEITIRFLILMVKKNFFFHFDSVIENIEKFLDKRHGVLRAHIDYTFPMDKEFEEKIKESIKKRTGVSNVELSTRLNPDLIGGYKLQIGDELIDASIQSQLQKLETDLLTGSAASDSPAGEELISDYGNMTGLLEQQIKNWGGKVTGEYLGQVVQVGDSVTVIHGLSGAMYGELLEFSSGATGIAMNLEEEGVGCVLLSGEDKVKDGEKVKGTGRVVSVPSGPSLFGRVVNPLGEPIDGKGPIRAEKWLPVEAPAAPVIDRGSVDIPMQTGLLSIDSMIPIGRGQRELIIGDRQTGKTALAIDAIINQKGKNVICVYCAIGQKTSSVAAIISNLEKADVMDYTFVVLASASDSAAFQYLAPYSAVGMAEHFMHQGRDVLIVYDDLSKHAVAYRAISLLLRRPPGREAFPGDVFYLHSRLLERAAKLSPRLGGGSITALPIVETQAGDISSYIPTNVISITDGQIFLDTELFNSGFRPAVDVGLSVSRVGGSAQFKAIRKIAGRLRLDLAQYREMASFAQFGSDLDKATQNRLAQGERLMEVLKQAQHSPYTTAQQYVILFVSVNGHLMDLETKKIPAFVKVFLEFMNTHHKELMENMDRTGELSSETNQTILEAVEDCKHIGLQGQHG